MARFSKAALLKWLEAQQEQAEQLRDNCGTSERAKARRLLWDGEAVAYLATRCAIERGEIGEGK
jgi:hypothetical protein